MVSIVDYKLEERNLFETLPITIGRLSKNDIAIKHKQISREHARIVTAPGGTFLIEDMNSMNYVYVNRKQTIREALEHGDLINVGGVADFLFLMEEDDALATKILEKLKADPEYSPANFALKKTMASLVDELSQSQIHVLGEQGKIASPGLQGGLEDIESLYEIAYTINSCIDLGKVLKVIVKKVLEVTGAERGFVMLKPPDRDLHPGAAGSGAPPLEVKIAQSVSGDLEGADRESFSKSIVLKAIDSGDTYVSTNAAEDPIMQTHSVINYAIREAMCAPLRVRNDIIGTIYVDTRQVKGNFNKRDILFFEAICHQAAIALSNARMTEDLRSKQVQLQKAYADLLDRSKRLSLAKKIVEQKVKELSALNAVASGISMGGDLDTMLRLVLEKSVDVLSAEWGLLKLVDDDEEFLQSQVEVGGHGKHIEKRLRINSDNIWTQALKTEKPVVAVRGDPDRSKWLPGDPEVSIVMAIPLVHNRRKIGVIGIFNPRHKRPFSKEEVTLGVSLANQASVTIENVRLYNLAIYDGLTNLHLRRYFDIWLQKEFDRTRRYKGKLSLIMIDLDHFKNVNDQYGHQCGDEVLRTLGALIRDSIRSVDLGARYGGEEFAVILPETDLEGAMLFADRLRARVESTPIRWDARLFPITFSAGVSTFSGNEKDITCTQDLIERADKAMYRSKEEGRNRVTSYRDAFLNPTTREVEATGAIPAVSVSPQAAKE
jgi:diguanylate cyclase (GGDEF)-like protein